MESAIGKHQLVVGFSISLRSVIAVFRSACELKNLQLNTLASVYEPGVFLKIYSISVNGKFVTVHFPSTTQLAGSDG
jgi:hypothetical protein